MFKRRKSDEAQAGAQPGEPASSQAAPGNGPAEGADGLFQIAPPAADSGLGVPPFRPMPPLTPPSPHAGSLSAATSRPASKEAPSMARPPFAATPAPSSPGPSAGSVPSQGQRPPGAMPSPGGTMSSSGAMPSPVMTAPPLPSSGPRPTPARDPADRRTLVVGRGISVQGTVQDAERLVVEGTVEASMIHATELSISPGGVFKGEVEVDDAEVAGTIDGTLTAKNSLIVRASGRLLGAARCKRLQVEDGGQITGRIEMITDGARADTKADAA